MAHREDGPRNYGAAGFWADNHHVVTACPDIDRADTGAVYVFSKKDDPDTLVNARPSFIMHGVEDRRLMDAVQGDMDINGDGLSDFVFGALRYRSANGDDDRNNRGGFGIVLGRPLEGASGYGKQRPRSSAVLITCLRAIWSTLNWGSRSRKWVT